MGGKAGVMGGKAGERTPRKGPKMMHVEFAAPRRRGNSSATRSGGLSRSELSWPGPRMAPRSPGQRSAKRWGCMGEYQARTGEYQACMEYQACTGHRIGTSREQVRMGISRAFHPWAVRRGGGEAKKKEPRKMMVGHRVVSDRIAPQKKKMGGGGGIDRGK